MSNRPIYSLRYHDLKKAMTLLAALLALVAFSIGTPSRRPKTDAATSLSLSNRKAPAATPVVLQPPRITSPQSGATVDTGQLTVTGTGPPGLAVRLYDGERLVDTTSVQNDGSWSLTLSGPLGEGDHQLTVVTVDVDGHVSAISPPLAITVVLRPPPSPVILWPTTGQILRAGRPTLTGTAKPGSTVRLLRDGQLLGSAKVPADGNWNFALPEPLSEGLHTLTALAEDVAGLISEPSAAVVVNVISPPLTAPQIFAPAREEIIQGQELPLLGTATPGAIVWVFSGEQVLGTAETQADGRWTFRLPATLDEGTHRLRAAVVDEGGRTSPLSPPVAVRVLPRVMAAPTITSPSGDVALMRSRLTLSGVAQPGSTVEVRDGQALLGTTQAGLDGRWIFSLPEPLSVGEHELIVVASDGKGHISPPSQPLLARVSAPPLRPVPTPTPIPVPIPVITSPVTAEFLPGDVVTVTGAAPPGATVAIYDGEVLLGSVQVGDDGTWSLALSETLAVGQHHLSAVAVDKTGRTSQPSEAAVVEIIVPAPLLPVTGGDRGKSENRSHPPRQRGWLLRVRSFGPL